ncbi:MAG: hypothetical protein ACRC5C_10125, partial [Bacilli bacterium]
VRAGNEKGWSDWNHIKETTADAPEPPPPPAQKVYQQTSGFNWLCWRTAYTIIKSNGQKVTDPGGWRTQSESEHILQGEWVELVDKVESGISVKKGTKWGNHRSIIVANRTYWMDALKGKKIKKVEIYLQRASSQHGFPSQGNDLYIGYHKYPSFSQSVIDTPPIITEITPMNVNFQRGTGLWVTLPTKWGTFLQSGSINGFGLYNARAGQDPQSNYSYMRFEPNQVKIRVTTE